MGNDKVILLLGVGHVENRHFLHLGTLGLCGKYCINKLWLSFQPL